MARERKAKCWNCGDTASYRTEYGPDGKPLILNWCRECIPVGTIVRHGLKAKGN